MSDFMQGPGVCMIYEVNPSLGVPPVEKGWIALRGLN